MIGFSLKIKVVLRSERGLAVGVEIDDGPSPQLKRDVSLDGCPENQVSSSKVLVINVLWRSQET
jgi:hypothetical protein